MNRITFNSTAVVLLLLVLPLAVGAITNTSSTDEDRNWTASFSPDSTGSSLYAQWVNNGEDFSDHYATNVGTTYGSCSYIAPLDPLSLAGGCLGSSGVGSEPHDLSGEIVSNTVLGVPAIEMPVSHNSIPAGDYLGSSGAGPFSWAFTPNTNQIPEGDIPEAFRWTFIQPAASYACTSSNFVEFEYDLNARWLSYDPTAPEPIEEIFTIEEDSIQSTNMLQMEAYVAGHWTTACFVGLQVQLDLTGYEQVALNNAARDTNWSSIYLKLTLDDFQLTNTTVQTNIGQTALPWAGDAGDGDFLLVQEFSTTNEAQVNFFIRGGTLVLGIIVLLIGIGSTPYWDPLQNWFRGRL